MSVPRVDIGIACSAHQVHMWWVPLLTEMIRITKKAKIEICLIHAVSSALPDHNKNNIISQKKRLELTDSNRQGITKRFLDGGSDWLFQLDDDTVPPDGAIESLISKSRDFIAGVYFLPGPPHNPIAYIRQEDGFYYPYWGYPQGALVQVDSVGMGCTLIHRSVFEKIQAEHELYQRPDGTLMPVHHSQIKNYKDYNGREWKCYVENGIIHMPVTMRAMDDDRPWPFYALEYGRTEDHYFCELAANVGIRPWLDTTIECDHYKTLGKGVKDYRESLAKGEKP